MKDIIFLSADLHCASCDHETAHGIENGVVACVECGYTWGKLSELPEYLQAEALKGGE